MDPSLVLTSTQKKCRFRKREKMKSIVCPELIGTDESEQIETQGEAVSDIIRTNELEPKNEPINNDLATRNTENVGPDVSMLGIEIFCRTNILDYIIACLMSRYLFFINLFMTLQMQMWRAGP